ncbi:MAG: GspH/FimT family pseudopilin [Curvibacter sp.]
MRDGPTPRRARGFTLIELMTVVVILTVLTLVAAPGLQSLISGQRARSAAHDLISDLILARSEAVKRNRDVVLAPVTEWSAGWRVQTASTAELIGQRNPVGGEVRITRSPAQVTYDASGRLSGAAATVRFEVFDGRQNYRCISIDPSGQPSTQTKACP